LVRWIMKRWIRAAVWFRFRKVSLVFHSPLPMDGGAILAGNHQNAILDSLTLASSSPRTPFTLSRASLFNNRAAAAFLGALRMIPIYRFRDGFGKMRKNAEVFAQFVEVLGNDEWLLMFPEGNHELRYTMRTFQKGIARIAFAAQVAQDWEGEIPIIPVGLQYESHSTFGSRLLIQFGPPISTVAFQAVHSRNPKEAERALTQKVFDEIKHLLVLPPPDEEGYERAVRRLELNKGRFPDLMEQFRADQKTLSGEVDPPPGPHPRRNRWRKMAGYVLSLPGLVLHLPAILLVLALEKAFMRDAHLIPAARFTAGGLFVPPWYLLALCISHLLTQSLALDLLLLGLMPMSLWLWSRTWYWTR